MIRTENQSKNKNNKTSPHTERKITKKPRNIINRICINNPIVKVSTYSINDLSSLKINKDKINTNSDIGFFWDKEPISKILPKKNGNLNLLEITNNENNQVINGKNFRSNSFTNINEIFNNNKYHFYNELNVLLPKIRRTMFHFSDYKCKNRTENGSLIYNKKILKTNSGFIPKINLNSKIIRHKRTDNGLSFNNFKRINNI